MTEPIAASMPLRRGPFLWQREIWIALVVGWAARAAFIAILPAGAGAMDIAGWERVAALLGQGKNPYTSSTFLNWPPLWMQVIYVLSAVSATTGVAFRTLLRIVLIGFESGTLVVCGQLLLRLRPDRRPLLPLLIGFSLNPLAIFYVCYHCNFDILFIFCVMLTVQALVRFHDGGDPVDWLLACLYLGLGVLTKTVPLCLFPLLFSDVGRLSGKVRIFGATLVGGLALLGLSVLYVMDPSTIYSNVIAYRSVPRGFGITGVLWQMGYHDAMWGFTAWFGRGALGVLILLGLMAWRRRLAARDIVLLGGLLLTGITAAGTGFGWQYLHWPMPLLVASSASFGRLWRNVLLASLVVASAAGVFAYGLMGSLGALFCRWWPGSGWAAHWSYVLSNNAAHTLLTLPVFICLWVIVVTGAVLLVKARGEEGSSGSTGR